MAKKIKETPENLAEYYISVHIYAILDLEKRKITKISLDEDEIDEELILMDDSRFVMVETDIVMTI